jgi:hypothetical protein
LIGNTVDAGRRLSVWSAACSPGTYDVGEALTEPATR